ncbi:MAG: SCO family protein [Anaerolineales bacterium]
MTLPRSLIVSHALLLSLAVLVAACGAPPTDDPGAPYAGTRLEGTAPDFELLDQTGASVAGHDFQGKVVALTFLDSRCRDVCPLTSAELIAAWLGLTEDEQHAVAFLGINVNPEENAIEDVATASREWRLAEIPAWRFLTGPPDDLQAIWDAYPIEVQPGPAGAIDHTSGVFLIDSTGALRWYVSVPLQDPAWSGPRLAEILVRRLRELIAE